LDQDTRRKRIIELYTDGKITVSQRKTLEQKISEHYKSVSDTTDIENHEGILTASSTTKEYDKSGSTKSVIGTVTSAAEVASEEEYNSPQDPGG
jgi:hypothetical protein